LAVKLSVQYTVKKVRLTSKGVGKKISKGGRATEKRSINSKKIPENSNIKPLSGEEGGALTENRPKNSKKKTTTKNSTFKPLCTIIVPCMKIQGRNTAPCPPLPTSMLARDSKKLCMSLTETFVPSYIFETKVKRISVNLFFC